MKLVKHSRDATNTFLYRHCMPAWWPALDAHRKIWSCNKGERIFSEGEEVTGVYFMVEGVAKVHKYWTADKELIIRFISNNDIIGHRGLSTQSKVYPVSVTALTKSVVCYIDLAFFRSTIAVNPDFTFAFMMFFADELQASDKRMRDLAHMPVTGRLAQALLSIREKFSTNADGYISFPFSRHDIAAYTGAAYETVYRILLEWSDNGIIKTSEKFIALTDQAALQRLAMLEK